VTEQTENGVVDVEEAAERKPTERVILERVAALVIPADATVELVDQAAKVLQGKSRTRIRRGEAWVEVSRQTAAGKTMAVELYAGKSGTADAKVGVWRAPTVTAWKGAIVHEAPPAPLVERRVIE
jgi:hypothetical protein